MNAKINGSNIAYRITKGILNISSTLFELSRKVAFGINSANISIINVEIIVFNNNIIRGPEIKLGSILARKGLMLSSINIP